MRESPHLQRFTREEAAQADGIVIVIDVIRAFTVAAQAFARGARELWLVLAPEDALALRERDSAALLAGEKGGRLIPGFDFNNSPYLMSRADVAGRRLIQRTGAGTRGAVEAVNASYLLICSLNNARATALYAQQLSNTTGLPISFLPTATSNSIPERNEDDYCADYIEALLTNQRIVLDLLQQHIQRLFEQDRFSHWNGDKDPDFPPEDLDKIVAIDCFDFVMLGTRRELAGITYIQVQKYQPQLTESI
jgi:2-phosphosulfolactate phosphatase